MPNFISSTASKIALFLLFSCGISQAQVVGDNHTKYTRADTLRGSLRPERINYDALKYHLKLKVEPDKKFISGSNVISFEVLKDMPVMQLDLFRNMEIDSVIFQDQSLEYEREYNAVFLSFPEPLKIGVKDSLEFFYHGQPVIAKNAPWDGGFVWTQDEDGNPWVGVAVQGTGASLWYPNKDHQSDEPDSAQLDIAVPNGLMNVSNGRFIGKTDLGNGFTEWRWKVVNPINNYDVMINIGNYEHFSDTFQDLDLDYYVLPYNLEKAKKQFAEVKDMMACFYEKMGPYPFEEDGYKLVEVPYLGMEHQSAVAYGNHYQMGYLGRDLSGTGIGLKWDFIIIHESGHEWYGNSITSKDIADMWIHEGFTSYTEAIYIECRWGKEKALEYLKGTRKSIGNVRPVIGEYGVNAEGSGDMYPKGSNLLNMIRSIYNDDELWWNTLRDYTATFKHQTVTTQQVENFFDQATEVDLKPVFDQYLRHAAIPELQFKKEKDQIFFRWKANVENFKMPVDVFIDEDETRLNATTEWQALPVNEDDLDEIELNELKFYVNLSKQ
ncbi:M1 family metallopeptidase [Christiangramia flava]|uniref:Peptidase M1 family protein n=1 Tax=Christiangramia flava JLT2011 TaxID=1229726 RepID=A0A1L7I6L2_9FLAO|nr:M1 family metallopeptidase [Christiangramia flava]APU69231.1 Peptidase M1 family protein [Christiangramia flava JLT2011]OSS38869.1 Peptidase M1 family protein [Christiangramia flava JLT2011]